MTAAVRFVVALLALLAPLALAAAMLSLSEWAGADQGHTESLHIAIQANDLENVVHLLETHDVRPTSIDLRSAVSQDVHLDILATLIVPGRGWRHWDWLLIPAIWNANSSAVRLLIDAGVNVNVRDSITSGGETRTYTALRWNAEWNWQSGAYIRIRDMLLAAGAHWGTECLGRAVTSFSWRAPCICLSPNVGVISRYGRPEQDGSGCVRGNTPAECENLGGELQSAGGEADRICSGVDWNDTFCILGSVDVFPCAYFFAHVKECNALNRPALDPWHCGPVCPNRGFAIGAACTKTPPLRGNED